MATLKHPFETTEWSPQEEAPADYWIPPNASFGNDPSGQINQQNPWADPGRPFVNEGTTGGYLKDVGVTLGQGTSQTAGQAKSDYDAGVAKYGQSAVDDFLRRNTGANGIADYNRIDEALAPDFAGGSGGGSGDGSSGGGGGSNRGGSPDALRSALMGLWGGGMNQNIINSRLSNAKDTLNRQRKSTLASNQALLANRGLMGMPGAPSGAEGSTYARMDTDLADRFANAATGIYADESENADQRMMDALRISAGLDTADQDRALQAMLGTMGNDLGWFNANTNRDLGMGNLALGNMNAVNSYNMDLARFGLDRDLAMAGLEQGDIQVLIDFIRELQRGAQTSAGGYV